MINSQKIIPLKLDGLTYTRKFVDGLRQPLLAVKDCLEEQDRPDFALAMRQIHDVLCYYIAHVNE